MRILVVFKEISRQWNTLFAEKAIFFHGNETRNLQRKPCGFPGDISLGCPRRQQVFVGSVEVCHVGMWPLLPGQRTHFCWWFSTQPRVFSHVQYIIHIFSVLYIFFWILYLLHIYYSIYLLYIDIHIFYRWGVIGFTIPNLKIFIGTVNHQDIWVVDYYLLTLQQDLAVAKIVVFLSAAHLVSNPNHLNFMETDTSQREQYGHPFVSIWPCEDAPWKWLIPSPWHEYPLKNDVFLGGGASWGYVIIIRGMGLVGWPIK